MKEFQHDKKRTKKNDLTHYIDMVGSIYINSRSSFEIEKYIAQSKSEIARITFFKQILISCKQIAIIDLHKLVIDKYNNDFSIPKLINKLSPGGDFKKYNFPSDSLAMWSKWFLDHNCIISKIDTLRDTEYAHSDGNHSSFWERTFDYEELEMLYEFLNSVIVKIYDLCFPGTVPINNFFQAKSFNLFERIDLMENIERKNRNREN